MHKKKKKKFITKYTKKSSEKMAIRVSCKSILLLLLLLLLLILFLSSPTKARSLRETYESGKSTAEKGRERRSLGHGGGGGSDGDGLVDMDYNTANKKTPIHNRRR
ncbi:PREDICTED: root meristem growth factor 9 [Tarenaya hassleriana]|uniref:root meristem growth factor 9 n=1 Tax=Tarenaya hassleriana TaxID=28532 RepID=UPI0008FCFB19|nr:PREDICTED: root meristem growth factor 9 [Tarenaya hassleriana]